MTYKCELCGHHFTSEKKYDSHMWRDHGASLDRWTRDEDPAEP